MIGENTTGFFPFAGERLNQGKAEPVVGRILWDAEPSISGGDAMRTVAVRMFIDGESHISLPSGKTELTRKFVGRLGEYDHRAQVDLVGMMTWASDCGYNIRVDEGHRMLSTRGAIPVAGVRSDRGKAEEATGSVSWRAMDTGKGDGKRMVLASMAICDGPGFFPDGEVSLAPDFVRRLSEEDRETQGDFIGMMDWKTQGFDVRPV